MNWKSAALKALPYVIGALAAGGGVQGLHMAAALPAPAKAAAAPVINLSCPPLDLAKLRLPACPRCPDLTVGGTPAR